MSDDLVLGVDGGGSGCRAILTTLSGAIIASQTGAPCNYQNSNTSETRRAISDLIERTFEGLSLDDHTIRYAVFGLAGMDTDEDRRILTELVNSTLDQHHIKPNHLIVENDGVVTLRGLVGSGPGVLLLSGTGSIAWGVSPGKPPVRSGGWGPRLGDEGSGFAIGRATLLAAFHGYDGRGPKTGMEAAVLEALHCHDFDEVADKVYSNTLTVSGVARLAPVVLRLAQTGNDAARHIVQTAVADLAKMVTAVATRLNLPQGFQIALCGGILENHPVFRKQVMECVSVNHPGARWLEGVPSALGAISFALRQCHTDTTEAFQALRINYATAT